MKKGCTLLLFTFWVILGNAQKEKTRLYLLPQVALLNGDYLVSGQVQLSGGMIIKKRFSVGIGAAVDYYHVRTVPVFIETRAAFGKSQRIFSYLSAGTNRPWALQSQYQTHWLVSGTTKDEFTGGAYADLGIGYAFSGATKKGWMMSIGYSMKNTGMHYTETVFRDFPPYGFDVRERSFNYTFNRIAVKLGVQL